MAAMCFTGCTMSATFRSVETGHSTTVRGKSSSVREAAALSLFEGVCRGMVVGFTASSRSQCILYNLHVRCRQGAPALCTFNPPLRSTARSPCKRTLVRDRGEMDGGGSIEGRESIYNRAKDGESKNTRGMGSSGLLEQQQLTRSECTESHAYSTSCRSSLVSMIEDHESSTSTYLPAAQSRLREPMRS